MDAVGRDQAQRGQLIAKPVTRSVRHRDREHDQHREKDGEMLARVKEFDGDNDKLLVKYQQDTDNDVHMDIEAESTQELKDCVDELRRESRRVLRHESLRESLRAWLRVQVSRVASRMDSVVYLFKCVHTQSENAASEFWEIS